MCHLFVSAAGRRGTEVTVTATLHFTPPARAAHLQRRAPLTVLSAAIFHHLCASAEGSPDGSAVTCHQRFFPVRCQSVYEAGDTSGDKLRHQKAL